MNAISLVVLLCMAVPPLLGQHKCEKEFWKTQMLNGDIEIHVLLIWFPINAGTQTTLSLCSNETGLPVQRRCGYDRLKNFGKWQQINEQIKLLNCSTIATLCMEEPFEHNYIMKNGVAKPFSNKWKTTLMTERGDLQEPCLLETGIPLTRRCEYSPMMRSAQWELLSPDMRNTSCLRETREVIVTYDLNALQHEVQRDMLEDKLQPQKVIQQMGDLLTTAHTVRIPADIKISGEILKAITTDSRSPELVAGVLNVTDIIMASNRPAVVKAEEVNATTNFLKTIDNFLQNMAEVMVPTSRCQSIADGIANKTFARSSVFYINPSCSNISGLATYSGKSRRHRIPQHHRFDEYTGNYYRFLYLNETLEQILNEPDLILATYIPLTLWNKLKSDTVAVDDQTVLAFILFQNDVLFVNHTAMHDKPIRNILEISIPNYSGELPEDAPFVFSYQSHKHYPQQKPVCGYWNYSTWITTGIKTEYKSNSNGNLLICHSTHLTHFAAIFGVSFLSQLSVGDEVLLSISHDLMLDYISIAGCSLSLLGLACIWMTAICFRSFRIESSNKVLLNMCLVLSLLMLFFLLLNMPQLWQSYINMGNTLHCQIMGAFLHYIIVVLFFWMLIIAVMQHQRYVRVLGYERPSNYITKYAIIAWGLPLIPVGVVVYWEPNTYMPSPERIRNHTDICYPSGDSLKYGVILPIALIMCANLFIFIYIFSSLRRSLNTFKHRRDRNDIIVQIRVSVLLFFLLGISWIFGLLSRLEGSPAFSYLFCLTSTLQGFVLFLYSIVIDKTTRSSWIILCCARNYNTMEDKNRLKNINCVSWK